MNEAGESRIARKKRREATNKAEKHKNSIADQIEATGSAKRKRELLTRVQTVKFARKKVGDDKQSSKDKDDGSMRTSFRSLGVYDDEIRFYSKEVVPELSNFYVIRNAVEFDGKLFKSTEHLFQWAKYSYDGASDDSLEYAELIRTARTPNIAREIASQRIKGGYPWRTALNPTIQSFKERGVSLRVDWLSVRDDVMLDALRCKFSQDPHCRDVLLGTDDKKLIEHTHRDW